jgi:hypothetical protein
MLDLTSIHERVEDTVPHTPKTPTIARWISMQYSGNETLHLLMLLSLFLAVSSTSSARKFVVAERSPNCTHLLVNFASLGYDSYVKKIIV